MGREKRPKPAAVFHREKQEPRRRVPAVVEEKDAPPPSLRRWIGEAGAPWLECAACALHLQLVRPGARLREADVCRAHGGALVEHQKIAERWPWHVAARRRV